MAGPQFVIDFEPMYGEMVDVSPLLRRLVCKNPSKFTFHGTGTYVIGRGDVAVVDPGPRDDEAMDRIEAEFGNLRAVSERAAESGEGGKAAQAVLGMARTMNVRAAPRQLAPLLEAQLASIDTLAPEDGVRLPWPVMDNGSVLMMLLRPAGEP